MIAGDVTTSTATCDHKQYPQACANYYSAIKLGHPASFACSKSQKRINAAAVQSWKDQHANDGWKAFKQSKNLNNKNEMVDTKCDVDEYPVSGRFR